MNFESPYWLIPIFIFLFAFIYWARTRKDPLWHRRIVDRANKVMAEVPAVITPQYQKKVYYEPGVGSIDLTAVDEGFSDTMDRLACQGYPVNKEQHDLKVIVFESELSPETKTPSFRVPILAGFDPYYNSEWDMMKDSHERVHYILAAGMTIAAGHPLGDQVVIPYSANRNDVRLGVDHEAEHFGLSWYDGPRADANQYHQQGPHRFIPPCPGAPVGLAARNVAVGTVGPYCVLLVK